MTKATFLDRDGVLCRHRPDYVKSWDEFQFLPGVIESLRELASLNHPIIVVTNQSCIGRGIVRAETVDDINSRMVNEIHKSGGRIDGVFLCPHHPEAGCKCRKPGTGMIDKAVKQLGLNPAESWVVGDNISDIQMGRKAGCRTILVRSGLGETFITEAKKLSPPPLIVKDLAKAVKIIIHDAKSDDLAKSHHCAPGGRPNQ
jgi:D-glycero-D-manno-heptose 1,7-bisphosphate phosphatase